MPVAECTNCHRITNSSTSNYWLDTEDDGQTPKEVGVATRCYAAFENDGWVEGCEYGNIDSQKKSMIDGLLTKQGV